MLRRVLSLALLAILVQAPNAVAAGVTLDDACTAIARALAVKLNQIKGPCAIAVTEIDVGGASTELGKLASNTLSDELVNKAQKFTVVDRAHLDRVMAEHKFGLSGLADPETVKKMGKLLGAAYLVVGGISPAGGHLRFAARAIDVETGQVLATGKEFVTNLSTIKELIPAGFKLESTPVEGPKTGERPQPPQPLVPNQPEPPAQRSATLRIETDPEGAGVEGHPSQRYKGKTPLDIEGVSAGKWAFKLSAPGYEDRVITGSIRPGETQVERYSLRRLDAAQREFADGPVVTPGVDGSEQRPPVVTVTRPVVVPTYVQPTREVVRTIRYGTSAAPRQSYLPRTSTQVRSGVPTRDTIRAVVGGIAVLNELAGKGSSRKSVRAASLGVLGINEVIRR